MVSIHRAFAQKLKETPQLLLQKLIQEKLAKEAQIEDPRLAEALAKHYFNGESGPLQWDDGSSTDGAITLSFTEEDGNRLAELSKKLVESLPTIVENTTKLSAETLAKTLKRNWPEQKAYQSHLSDEFRLRLESRWGKGFDLLRMLLTFCRDLGGDCAARLRKSKSNKNRTVRDLVIRLHARACQIMAEIIALMENGFADGAMARWRTMYELGIVATVIADAGEALAKSYIEHEVIESKLALDEYTRCHELRGDKRFSPRDRRRIENAFAAAVKKHGTEFGKPYGWAAAHFRKKKMTFRDLEDIAQHSSMRSYYKLASYNVHADTAKSLFCRLGVIDDQSIVITGATNAGFREPGQNAAYTIVQITTTLLAGRLSNLDVMIQLQALLLIRDQVPGTLSRIERKLNREHAGIGRAV